MIPPTFKAVLPETEARTATDPDAAMSPEQKVELRSLCEATGEDYDEGLTQEQAAQRIDVLRDLKAGRQETGSAG